MVLECQEMLQSVAEDEFVGVEESPGEIVPMFDSGGFVRFFLGFDPAIYFCCGDFFTSRIAGEDREIEFGDGLVRWALCCEESFESGTSLQFPLNVTRIEEMQPLLRQDQVGALVLGSRGPRGASKKCEKWTRDAPVAEGNGRLALWDVGEWFGDRTGVEFRGTGDAIDRVNENFGFEPPGRVGGEECLGPRFLGFRKGSELVRFGVQNETVEMLQIILCIDQFFFQKSE